MRLVGRILLLLVSVGVPAGVAGFGCNGEPTPYPGITDDIPNSRGGGVSPGDTSVASSSAASSSAASSSSSAGMPAGQLCSCASNFVSNNMMACGNCTGNTTAPGGPCEAANQACMLDVGCVPALSCTSQCTVTPNAPATCAQGCLKLNTTFQALAACFCMNCPSCESAVPLPCNL